MNRPLFTFFLSLLTLTAFAQPKYEFRAVWIATVDNIDWPQRGNYNTGDQKAEFIRQLDMHQRNGMNAVIVQVRPACDAFYPSTIEPWSEWLTGQEGRAPVPFYDPLEFMIRETHKRGMEFHAWCNPYRAVFRVNHSSIAANHVSRLHPDWILTYGDTRYLDPGNKQVQDYVVAVIRDMLHRYDIDALHFDDYFYPYRIAGKEFPDGKSFAKYGNGLDKETWRRSNVDSVILKLSRAIHQEKKQVKFGVSPFGVWRNDTQDPDGSATLAGQTNYGDLYADILLWLKNGWIDYVVPQLYWEFEHRHAPFAPLVDWWNRHSYGRPCYVGIGYYRAGSNQFWKDANQLPRQLNLVRENKNLGGMVYFSSKSFDKNPLGWNDTLQQHFYNYPALIEPMPWLDAYKPSKPVSQLISNKDSVVFQFRSGNAGDTLKGYAVYRTVADTVLSTDRVFQFIPESETARFIVKGSPESVKAVRYFVTAISRTNNESDPLPINPPAAGKP